MNMNDAEHIWLRQTVTYTVDGQTRTLEIGVPVPRDASPEEIEELLRAADAGMGAISRRLDAHIAATTSGAAPQLTAPETQPTMPTMPTTTAPASPERAAVNGRAPAAPTPVAEPAAPSQPPQASARPAPAAPTTPTTAPTPQTPQTPPTTPPVSPSPRAPERQSAPQRAAAQPPARPAAPATPVAPPSPVSASGAEMTRPEFLAAANELGLNPRQAMDRLKVRSLEGLNLREALESLRRQMLGAAAAPEPERLPEPEPEPAIAPTPVMDATSRYFEEEDDDETIFYSADGEDEDDEFDTDILAPSSSPAPLATDDAGDDFMDEPDEELDLEDVPDLAPPSPSPRRRVAPATPARETAAAPAPPAAATPATPATPAAPSGGARTQAMQLIGKLRAATGGAPASDYQLTAYRNIVENELGKANATTLVRGLWRTTADRLSAGQLDALIRWGKEEVFAEEAALVLAALRAEQRRAEQASAIPATTAAPATRAATRRQSASRDGEAR